MRARPIGIWRKSASAGSEHGRTACSAAAAACPPGSLPRTAAFQNREPEAAWRRSLQTPQLIPQHHSAAAGHGARRGQTGFHVRDLPGTGFTAELLHRLDDVIEPVNVAFRQKAPVGVKRQRAIAGDASALDEGAALAFLAELQALELHDDAVGEA